MMTTTWVPWESVPELVRVYILGPPKMSFNLNYRTCYPRGFNGLLSVGKFSQQAKFVRGLGK